MQILDLNLASRPFRNNSLLWLGYGLGLVLLVAVSLWNVDVWRRYQSWLTDLRVKVESIDSDFAKLEQRQRVAEREIEKYDLETLAVQADKANDVIRWKSFSWTGLFNQLEELQPNDVRMTTVRPVFRERRELELDSALGVDDDTVPVSVEGTAKQLTDFLELERALFLDPHFDGIEPERTATDEKTSETIFQLRFLYDPTAEPAELALEEAGAEAGGAAGAEPSDDAAPPEEPSEEGDAGEPGAQARAPRAEDSAPPAEVRR